MIQKQKVSMQCCICKEVKTIYDADIPIGCEFLKVNLFHLPDGWQNINGYEICNRHDIVILVDGEVKENLLWSK